MAGKSFRSEQREFAKQDFAFRTQRDHRQSLQGSRAGWIKKECIVLDYSETSLLAHWIRDEIREVAPRTYLGKVYLGKKRLIDFALEFPAAT